MLRAFINGFKCAQNSSEENVEYFSDNKSNENKNS